MPTILEIAGTKKIEEVEGKSTLPLLRGEKVDQRENAVSSSSIIFVQKGVAWTKFLLNAKRMRVTSKD